VFLEEFDDELANLGTLLPAWRMQPDNMDRLRPIRRIFHTLKGSGRLVGARTLGEFAWKIEGMLNRVLDGSRPATPAVLAMVDNAHAALPQLNAALRHGQRISVDLQAMQAIADRVGAGEETYYVPLPVAAAPAAPVVEADGEDEISRILEAEAMRRRRPKPMRRRPKHWARRPTSTACCARSSKPRWKSTRRPCRTGCARRSRRRSRSATHCCARCTP
jgi:chemosensory pili system protein ChpA (sensor histidine kinase/response regulator)